MRDAVRAFRPAEVVVTMLMMMLSIAVMMLMMMLSIDVMMLMMMLIYCCDDVNDHVNDDVVY